MSHDLYRHFDKVGNLLYVGISLSAVSRLAQHRCGSDWYERIANITVEKFPTAKAAEEAERAAIKKERPLHNKAHAIDRCVKEKRGSAYADFEGVPYWSIRRWMICWMPDYDCFNDNPKRGKGKLIQWPDKTGESHSQVWPMATGACDMCVHDLSQVERRHWVLSTALGMIHNGGMSKEATHALLWPILEYRLGLPPDVAAPPGDRRFGKHAGATTEDDCEAA